MLTAVQPNPTSETSNRVRNELSGMRALAAAIESLPDDQARRRALRWAIDVFELKVDQIQATAEQRPSDVPTISTRSSDPTLTMDGLDDLFVPRESSDRIQHQRSAPSESRRALPPADAPDPDHATPAEPVKGVTSMLHGFVEDFQQLARDWKE